MLDFKIRINDKERFVDLSPVYQNVKFSGMTDVIIIKLKEVCQVVDVLTEEVNKLKTEIARQQKG